MDCRWTQAKLSERLGALLSAHERAQVEAHLHQCATCREVDRELRQVVNQLRELPAASVSASFMTRLRAALPAKPLPWWRVWLRRDYGFALSYMGRRAALAGTAATVLLTGTTGIVQHRQAERRAADYLALCAERHELYAARIRDEANDSKDDVEKSQVW